MNPVRFAQCNVVMKAPPNMDKCYDLHACQCHYPDGTPAVISAWRPTPEELVRLNLGEPIFLSLIGQTMPPAALIMDNPFETQKEIE